MNSFNVYDRCSMLLFWFALGRIIGFSCLEQVVETLCMVKVKASAEINLYPTLLVDHLGCSSLVKYINDVQLDAHIW